MRRSTQGDNASRDIRITDTVRIPMAELQFRFSRSGGKGGQNVNKVETRVELLFDIRRSPSLLSVEKERLERGLGGRVDSAGVLRIPVADSRSQWHNRELAIARFATLLRKALHVRRPRVATSATRGSKERRSEQKRQRSARKKERRRVEPPE